MGMSENHFFTILLSGKLKADDRLRAMIAGSRVIAADGGMTHADLLNVVPELWVGDFDSSDDALMARWPDVERRGFPPAKNETDGALAAHEAIARGARRLIMAGALNGERTDHGLMNMLFAVHLAEGGCDVMLTSGEEDAWPLLPGETSIAIPAGALFSVLGFSDLEGLSIDNAVYPLEKFEAPFGLPRTVSNVAGKDGGPVKINLNSGRGIVLVRPNDFTGV